MQSAIIHIGLLYHMQLVLNCVRQFSSPCNIFFFYFNLTVDRWSLWTCYRPSRTRTCHHWNNTPPFSCPTIPDTVRNVHPRDPGVTLSRSKPKPLCSPNRHVEFTWVHIHITSIRNNTFVYFVYFFNMADPLTLSEHDVLCFIKHAKLACFKIFDVCYLLILFAYSFFIMYYN